MKRIIIGAIAAATVVGIICLLSFKPDPLANMSADSINDLSEETGLIGEKIIGNPDEAKIIVYEYADFGCSHCADWNKKINNLMEKYDGKIALVFRSYNLGFTNGPAAARAATAAQIQGYFKEYKDLLFENQVEWYYSKGEKLEELFLDYFKRASNDSGDIGKFKEDMTSNSVKARLKFEQSMGKKINLTGTPTFRMDGKTIDSSRVIETIEQKMNM